MGRRVVVVVVVANLGWRARQSATPLPPTLMQVTSFASWLIWPWIDAQRWPGTCVYNAHLHFKVHAVFSKRSFSNSDHIQPCDQVVFGCSIPLWTCEHGRGRAVCWVVQEEPHTPHNAMNQEKGVIKLEALLFKIEVLLCPWYSTSPMLTDLIFNHIFSLFLSQDLIKYKSDYAGGIFALYKPLCRCAQHSDHIIYQTRVICHRQKVTRTSFLKQGWGQGTKRQLIFQINIVHLPNSWTAEGTGAVFCLELWNRNLSGNQYGVCLKINGSRPGSQYPGPDTHMV